MRRLPASLLILLAAACTPRRAPEGSPEPPPQVVLYGARLRSFEGERLVVSGRADRVTYQRSTGEVLGTNTLVRLPPGQGSRQGSGGSPFATSGGVSVEAPNMEGSLASKQWTGSGGVVVRTGDGMVGRTPRLRYDANNQQAHGDEGVTVKGPDYRLRADRFTLSFPDETFTFEGSVQTVLGAAE